MTAETLTFSLDGGSCSIELPAPGQAGHSRFSFGVAKAGTVMLFKALDELLDGSEAFTPVDVPAQMFVQGFHVDHMTPAFEEIFTRPGYSFQGFRHVPAQLALGAAAGKHCLFQVRDPRDVLTSLYFSIKSSHHVPVQGPEGERLTALRRELTERPDIDDFVLHHSKQIMREYADYAERLLSRDGVTVLRYEDVVYDKRGYVERLANWLDLVVSPDRLDAVAALIDERPQTEDGESHVRQVDPGDHVRKLHHDSVAELTRRFQTDLARFDYPETAPSGLGPPAAPHGTDHAPTTWSASHLHPSSLETFIARLELRAAKQADRWFDPHALADVAALEPSLDAVVVPLTQPEIPAAIHNIERWATQMPPLIDGQLDRSVDLVFVLNNDLAGSAAHAISAAFERQPSARAAFGRIRVTSAGLHGKYDAYEADRPVGPNNMFLFTMGACAGYDTILQIETDCIVTRPDWLASAVATVNRELGSKWILGSHYRGAGELEPAARRHINGNAFYRTGDPRFQEFVFNVYTQHYVEELGAPYMLGYDAALSVLVDRAEATQSTALLHRFGFTDFIHNYRTSDDTTLPASDRSGVIVHVGAGSTGSAKT